MSIKLTFITNNKTLIDNKLLFFFRKSNLRDITNKRKSFIKFQIKSFSLVNLNKDYYKILGVTPEADEKEIKNAYLKLVKKYHPDLTGGKTTEHFKEISNSFKILSDNNLKKYYDSNSEKVSKYYYHTSTLNEKNENSTNTNYRNYSEDYEFNNNQNRNDYYYKYSNKNFYKKRNYYEEQHANYYQDNKGNSNYYNNGSFRFEFSDLMNDFLLFFPKIFMVFSFFLFCYMITRKTKNEYHLFIE